MAAHACLKNEFTEDENYHNLMSWLIYVKVQTEGSHRQDYSFVTKGDLFRTSDKTDLIILTFEVCFVSLFLRVT